MQEKTGGVLGVKVASGHGVSETGGRADRRLSPTQGGRELIAEGTKLDLGENYFTALQAYNQLTGVG